MHNIHSVLNYLGFSSPDEQRAFTQLLAETGCLGDTLQTQGRLTDKQADGLISVELFNSCTEGLHWLHNTTQEKWVNRATNQQQNAANPSDSRSLMLEELAKRIKANLPAALEKAKTKNAEPTPTLVPVQEIKLAPEKLQFRLDEKQGVVEHKRFNGEWEQARHGRPILLLDNEVVDGNHRVEFAQRLNAEGKGPAQLSAYRLPSKDGFTVEDAKIIGAYINLIKEFEDPAKTHTEEQMRDAASAIHSAISGKVHKEILPELPDIKDMVLAAKAAGLSDIAFKQVEQGNIPVAIAAEVATQSANPAEQNMIMEILAKGIGKNQGSWQGRVNQPSPPNKGRAA